MAPDDETTRPIVKHSADIGGAALGSLLGAVASGPVGAAIGGAIGATVSAVVKDVFSRMLSKREEFRVATTGKFAIHFIQERLEAGDIPRNDGFFSREETGTSMAGEIFEGVLLRAKADHEERKAHFYARLVANVAFDSTCSLAETNYLLRLMERLTFSQLVF